MYFEQSCTAGQSCTANAPVAAAPRQIMGGDVVSGPRGFVPRVMFVDDERPVVDGLRRAFLDYPYHVTTATSPEAALELFRHEAFDVIVADERMPGMQGSELLAIIAREFPLTGRILLTGHGTVAAAARAVNEAGVVRFLLKPCPPEDIRAAIEVALRTTPFDKRATLKGRRHYLVSQRLAAAAGRARGARCDASDQLACAANAAPTDRLRAGAAGARGACNANELILQAQRVVTLEEPRTLFGYELSARLRTPEGDLHTIGNFLASSEHYVRLSRVDRWALRHALQVVRDFEPVLSGRNLTISLNVAGQSLADMVFAQFIDRELSVGSVARHFLIEVRESNLVKSLQRDAGAIERLRGLHCFGWGCRLCIDGVGAAARQITDLNDLPVALVKIDPRFVRDILTNPKSAALIRSLVDWGRERGVAVAATGIDTGPIAERLRALGVLYGQGSAFGSGEPVSSALRALYS
jgi:EAL domain-containing protein (putative c-di-GMP-specific phosphodiesterase class I)/CheY-like chemotaxis protein